MPKQINHIKLDEAIKAALNIYKVEAEKMPFDQVGPHIQKKSSGKRHPFKEFAFSMNSFAGALSLTSFVNKEAIFVFAKKWAVAAYIVVGGVVAGAGGYYFYNMSFIDKKETVITDTEQTKIYARGSHFALINELASNAMQLVKNSANIITAVSTVTGQISEPNQNTVNRNITVRTQNNVPVQNTTEVPVAAGSIQATDVAVPNTETVAEPVELKVEDNKVDFGSSVTEEKTPAKEEMGTENTIPQVKTDNSAAEEKANRKLKEENAAAKKRTKKKKSWVFSKEALQH